jgi:hypothetical protein
MCGSDAVPADEAAGCGGSQGQSRGSQDGADSASTLPTYHAHTRHVVVRTHTLNCKGGRSCASARAALLGTADAEAAWLKTYRALDAFADHWLTLGTGILESLPTTFVVGTTECNTRHSHVCASLGGGGR